MWMRWWIWDFNDRYDCSTVTNTMQRNDFYGWTIWSTDDTRETNLIYVDDDNGYNRQFDVMVWNSLRNFGVSRSLTSRICLWKLQIENCYSWKWQESSNRTHRNHPWQFAVRAYVDRRLVAFTFANISNCNFQCSTFAYATMFGEHCWYINNMPTHNVL